MTEKQKIDRYDRIYTQLEGLFKPSGDILSYMATTVAVLHHKFDYYFWTGFYTIRNTELLVGPYQGPVACQLLKKDTGVCWAGMNKSETLIVDDVESFPGHIACNSKTKSEIVVPVYNKRQLIGVLDVDSIEYSSFTEADKIGLEKIISLLK